MVNVSRNLASVQSGPLAQTHKRPGGRDEGEESSPEGRRKEEIRAGERMAPTAWHLNRGFPLCTLSFLRFCFHKESFFHTAPSDACSLHSIFIVIPGIR